MFCFLYQDEEVKQVFNPAPFVSFRSVRNLRIHLVTAKVYPVGERLGKEMQQKSLPSWQKCSRNWDISMLC